MGVPGSAVKEALQQIKNLEALLEENEVAQALYWEGKRGGERGGGGV